MENIAVYNGNDSSANWSSEVGGTNPLLYGPVPDDGGPIPLVFNSKRYIISSIGTDNARIRVAVGTNFYRTIKIQYAQKFIIFRRLKEYV